MTHDIMDFIEYIHNEKQTSKNTEVSYERDLRKMNEYLEAQNKNVLVTLKDGSLRRQI